LKFGSAREAVFVQVFLQGKILGADGFVEAHGSDLQQLGGSCLYISLLSEAIPRGLLDSLKLSPELLGSSGGGQFLVLLPVEILSEANSYLLEVTRRLAAFSGRRLRLVWASTENLGAWSDVRRRLDGEMVRWSGLNALDPGGLFDPFEDSLTGGEWMGSLFEGLPDSAAAVLDLTQPGLLRRAGDPHAVATHRALNDAGDAPATLEDLAARAQGRSAWGILRGEIDQYETRLRQAQSVEEYMPLTAFFKPFFTGEVQVLCMQGEFWRKVTVLSAGGSGFAVAGSWNALIEFAREMQRLYHRTAEEVLREQAGPEAKTLSMGLAMAANPDSAPAPVWAEAGRQLSVAKSSSRDSISIFGRVVDSKQLAEASELKNLMLRLVDEFGASPQFLGELGAFYRETDRILPARNQHRLADAQQRPWRLHRRLNRVLDSEGRHRDFQKARAAVQAAFLTRGQGQLKLKPSGRVALEWARLAKEAE
jgi:CRISPR-associated protein Csm1